MPLFNLPEYLRGWLRRIPALGGWLIAVPLVLVLLLLTGQLALSRSSPSGGADTSSHLPVDYRPWPFDELFQPVDPAILTEVFRDRTFYPDSNETPQTPGGPSAFLAALFATPTPTTAPPTLTPTASATPTATPRPTSTRPPVIPTSTDTPLPLPTTTPTVIWVPPTPVPPTNTPGPTNTPTDTPTQTDTPTITPTPTNTTAPTATPLGPLSGFNLGKPDSPPTTNIANIPVGGSMLVDLVGMGATAISTGHAGYDFVYYEMQGCGGICMDFVIVYVGTGPSGSCAGSTWYMVLNWGDSVASNNGSIPAAYSPEVDNGAILSGDLYLGSTTGVAVDVDDPALAVPAGTYPCLLIESPWSGGPDEAQVDSIEILP